jgi:hypothetical protein
MEKKYRALETVSVIYKLAAILIFGGAVLVGGLTMVTPSMDYDFASNRFTSGPPLVLPGLGIVIGGAMAAVSTFAFGQLITLLIDLEENTRRTANLLWSARRPQGDVPQQLKKMQRE